MFNNNHLTNCQTPPFFSLTLQCSFLSTSQLYLNIIFDKSMAIVSLEMPVTQIYLHFCAFSHYFTIRLIWLLQLISLDKNRGGPCLFQPWLFIQNISSFTTQSSHSLYLAMLLWEIKMTVSVLLSCLLYTSRCV